MRCVPAHDFTVRKAYLWRSAIDEDPPYQRKSSVWSLAKQQLFIDSLLNGYDVPKIYLHDLRGQQPTKVYAVVDGKQRLNAIWQFLGDEFSLADDFAIEEGNLPELPVGATHPQAGMLFSAFHPAWKQVLRSTYLAVVLIQNASEQGIEDLFSRLNNGEPLNAAEKRNAMNSDMVRLIREVATRPFFASRLRFTNARYQHHDLAARLILIEATGRTSPDTVPDLRGRALDDLVHQNRRLSQAARTDLLERIDAELAQLCEIFGPADSLLARPSQPPLYYLFVKAIRARHPDAVRPERMRGFLARFQQARLGKPEETQPHRDPELAEFSRLMQHATLERGGLERRVSILVQRFLFEEGRPMAPAADG